MNLRRRIRLSGDERAYIDVVPLVDTLLAVFLFLAVLAFQAPLTFLAVKLPEAEKGDTQRIRAARVQVLKNGSLLLEGKRYKAQVCGLRHGRRKESGSGKRYNCSSQKALRMFFLKKVLTYAILPPGIYIILFLILGASLRKHRVLRLLALQGALTMYLISIEPFKDLLFYPLERGFSIPERVRGDVIVVLGGGAYNSGYLKASSYKRLITGFLLHQQSGKPLILSTGG